MPREIITMQVGQCGNQIGLKFWEQALKEHKDQKVYDDALSSFFRIGDKGELKARAMVVDMEWGVINNKILNGELSDIFESRFWISDQSGSGNNWAQGHFEYGPLYEQEIHEKVRQSVEECDSLQGFIFLHSLGGGTGSGLGTYLLRSIGDEYKNNFKFSTCVFPSPENDDVAVSPYNSMLALNCLIEYSDCVLPIENQSLFDISQRIDKYSKPKKSSNVGSLNTHISRDLATLETKGGSAITESKGKGHHFERENTIVAHVINNMTSSMRFEGSLNVDMNEITMNLVPFPRLHFLVSSLSPLYQLLNKKWDPRSIDQSFLDALDPNYQLVRTDPMKSLYLACGLIVRSKDIEISQVNRGVETLQDKINMIYWNKEGFKVGICKKPPINQDYSILSLWNSTGIRMTFLQLFKKFKKLYKHKAYLANYEKFGADIDLFEQWKDNWQGLISDYAQLESDGGKQVDEVPIEEMSFDPII
jgi:tubulin epsilon